VLLAFLKQTLGPEHDAVVRKKLVRQVNYFQCPHCYCV
jgi:high-affinity iron transporter